MGDKIYLSRYLNTEEITLEVEFLTPCFLGGANKSVDVNAELRTAPFKWALRYWWRVLYGSKYKENIAETEALIFGTARADIKDVGKSNVSIICTEKKVSYISNLPKGEMVDVTTPAGMKFKVSIFDYLAYGKIENRKKVYGNFIAAESVFTLKISISKLIGDHLSEVKNALYFFIKYGGIGAKGKNGFGCLNSNDIDKLKGNLPDCFRQEVSDFTSISKDTKYFETESKDNWEDALSDVGIAYKENKKKFYSGQDGGKRNPKNAKLGVLKRDGKFIGYLLYLPRKLEVKSVSAIGNLKDKTEKFKSIF